MNDLVVSALRALDSELKLHNVTTRVQLASQLPPVMGHGGQLQEVLVNLIQNAIDAMASADNDRRILQVRTEHNGDAISVDIVDTGQGIDPKKSDNIFDAFFTTKPNGMGLGLAICRMIVERHEGRLAVSSANPHGAIFRIKLPQMKLPHCDRAMSASLIGRLGSSAFRLIHRCSVGIARELALLFGLGTTALVWGFCSQAV
jgi:C4-dicarboxylate-specific signal transduction histidine kinase